MGDMMAQWFMMASTSRQPTYRATPVYSDSAATNEDSIDGGTVENGVMEQTYGEQTVNNTTETTEE